MIERIVKRHEAAAISTTAGSNTVAKADAAAKAKAAAAAKAKAAAAAKAKAGAAAKAKADAAAKAKADDDATSKEDASTGCTYLSNTDIGRRTHRHYEAKSKEECCLLCQQDRMCFVSVFSGGNCYPKGGEERHLIPRPSPTATTCLSTKTPMIERIVKRHEAA